MAKIQEIMARAETLAVEFAGAGTPRLELVRKYFHSADECGMEWIRGVRVLRFHVGSEGAKYSRAVGGYVDDGEVTPEILPVLRRWLTGNETLAEAAAGPGGDLVTGSGKLEP